MPAGTASKSRYRFTADNQGAGQHDLDPTAHRNTCAAGHFDDVSQTDLRHHVNTGKRPDKIRREAEPNPTEPLGTLATTQGVVKWWSKDKGYGAIGCDDLDPWDIWCHFSHIEDAGGVFRALNPGDPVEVEYMRLDQDSFKYVARRVRRLPPAPSTTAGAG